ncbi:ATP-binding protein [Streptomyces sp. NPDC051907]|uniref:ATP-binding protein n=1 Tax=Streptomyces sp. NPDC051907 TaxID=3155284 RepID=UPI00341D9886
MKQSAAKTLGVAALGAAFAAAAAGTAAAAPALTEAPSLSTVTGLVSQEVAPKLPTGTPQALSGAQTALGDAPTTLPATLQETGNKVLPGGVEGGDVVSSLLGGLPTKGLQTKGLPTEGLPTEGLPLGSLPVGTSLPGALL